MRDTDSLTLSGTRGHRRPAAAQRPGQGHLRDCSPTMACAWWSPTTTPRRAQPSARALPGDAAWPCTWTWATRNRCDDAAPELVERHGQVDILINSAGMDAPAPLEELRVADWDRVVRTNLTGPFLICKYGPGASGQGGHIVNIASTAARRAWPNASVYHADEVGLDGPVPCPARGAAPQGDQGIGGYRGRHAHALSCWIAFPTSTPARCGTRPTSRARSASCSPSRRKPSFRK